MITSTILGDARSAIWAALRSGFNLHSGCFILLCDRPFSLVFLDFPANALLVASTSLSVMHGSIAFDAVSIRALRALEDIVIFRQEASRTAI